MLLLLPRFFLLLLAVIIYVDCTKHRSETTVLTSVSRSSQTSLPSISVPFQLPHFSGSTIISQLGKKKSQVKSRVVRTTELSPVQGLLNTARDGVLDLRSSVKMIAASKTSEEFFENTLSALARHKAVTVTGLLGIYYFANRSIPDPMRSVNYTNPNQPPSLTLLDS